MNKIVRETKKSSHLSDKLVKINIKTELFGEALTFLEVVSWHRAQSTEHRAKD